MFDRAIMPWDSQTHPESTDFHIRLQQQEYQNEKEDLPGLMIFRPADPQTQTLNTSLFIFVVGETPTGGVNKEQFKTAIHVISNTVKAGTPLRIIGPTFSGSLYSLAQLLNPELSKRFNGIVIRSGTVSSWNTVRWFEDQWQDCSVDFATFQESDRYMLRKFVEFEKGRHYAPEKIALLAADETAYGNIGFASSSVDKTGPCQTEAPATPKDGDARIDADEASVLHLFFPRDISQLRSAYQQGFNQRASSSDNYQVHSTLPLNLQDSGSDDDTVPQYAHSETPLSQESILLGIVAALRDRRIEFVVLQATNPMDTLFLSAFLKKGYSGARVVATPADLLLSRDVEDVSLLHGVMTLSTYSLLPDIDRDVTIPASLQKGVHAGHVFPNAFAAGTYNAAVSQITCFKIPSPAGCSVSNTNTPADLPANRYTEYGWPSLGGRQNPTTPLSPVVWLTVLGQGGFWPIAILDDGSKPYNAGGMPSVLRPIHTDPQPCAGQYPGHPECCVYRHREFVPPWPLFWRIVSGFVLMLALGYWLLLSKSSIRASTSAMALLAPVEDTTRKWLIVVTGWLILVALLLLVWPWLSWGALGWVPSIPVIVAGVAALLLCGISAQQLKIRKAVQQRGTFLIVAALLVGFFVTLAMIGGHSHYPFLWRYIHLTSAVSPLLPLLCLLAAALWWAWFSLSGLALVDKRRPQLPKEDNKLPAKLRHSHFLSEGFASDVVRVAQPAARDPRVYGPALALLVITLCAVNYGHPLLTLEAQHFEWIFAVALGVVTFALFCTLFRLLVIWLECHKILTALDLLPLRRAFAGLNFAWKGIWRVGGGRWQDLYRLVSRQRETLEHLSRKVEEKEFADDHDAQELIRSIKETLQVEKSLTSRPDSHDPNAKAPIPCNDLIDRYKTLQERIAQTCAAAFSYLLSQWSEDEGLVLCEVSSGEDVKKDEDSPDLSLSTRLAERFVALVYLNFMLTILLRMRTLAITAGGLYIFLLLAVNSYPFEPEIALRSLAILLLICVVGMVGYVFAQIHRDSILSLVTQTKPGELGIEFWLRIGTFTALPLLSLLVSQFPTLNNALFSWLEPAVTALK
jgi:hypothetical protein